MYGVCVTSPLAMPKIKKAKVLTVATMWDKEQRVEQSRVYNTVTLCGNLVKDQPPLSIALPDDAPCFYEIKCEEEE